MRKRGGDGPTGDAGDLTPLRLILQVLPPILIVAGAIFYRITPPGLTASPFFAAAPLIAAPLYTLRGTIAVVVATLATDIGLDVWNGTAVQPDAITEMSTTSVIGLIAIIVNRLSTRADRRLASARYVSETAQRAVLPTPEDRIGGLNVAARYIAADADARIGGDLYAVQDTPYGVRAIVGDVRGKGLGAVEAVAVVIGAFREAAEQEPDQAGLAARLDAALLREGVRREGLDRFEGFTTAVLAEFTKGSSVLRVVNRGHPAPLVLHADGSVHKVEPEEASLPLGVTELGHWPDETVEVDFPPGATLVLFTDGVTEARDRRGCFYDPYERLGGRIFRGPEELLDGLIEDVARHTGGLTADDTALLAISRTVTDHPPSA
ncbi:PP2C family protein-serine/threonine phosphatase [Streptomyces boninensis]|uniref:PP2C family protein-serine/threonine phosphatase n=1 Tax=Streptomyces boninensis TaxID=2039455 RepID=UPI003B21125D